MVFFFIVLLVQCLIWLFGISTISTIFELVHNHFRYQLDQNLFCKRHPRIDARYHNSAVIDFLHVI